MELNTRGSVRMSVKNLKFEYFAEGNDGKGRWYICTTDQEGNNLYTYLDRHSCINLATAMADAIAMDGLVSRGR